ncbi:hypothetical protein GCM10009801_06010 [Streptomyces albiaxialis]|uniref:Uncharacterized protein n=1 Tax=Streptomyces albiaxialis TaxID=329523 RepID=A0ABN2VHN3_9ACTN
MPVVALVIAGAIVAFEQLVQLRFGVMGLVGFLFLTIGVKAKHSGCSAVGAIVLATLLLQA